MLGDDVVVEDHTLAAPRGRAGAPVATNGTTAQPAAKRVRKSSPRKRSETDAGTTPAAEPTKRASKAARSAAKS
jgi:hypothetical protein